MLANGSTEVNALRAEHAAAVRVRATVARRFTVRRAQTDAPTAAEPEPDDPAPETLQAAPDAQVSVFVGLTADAAGRRPRGIAGVTAQRADLLTAELSVSDALRLREHGGVAAVVLGQPLAVPVPAIGSRTPHRPSLELRRFGDGRRHGYGEGVLIGLIDVGGFDFAHPDFLEEDGRTRFVRIWDQGGDARPAPAARG